MANKIDLNTANANEIAKIPRIGREHAQQIVEYRDQNGDFNSWDDLNDIPGFSNKLIRDLKSGGAIIGNEGKSDWEDEY